MWWALIGEIAPRGKEMAGEKETACCVRCYHVYKQQFGKCWCVAQIDPTNVGRKITFA